MTIIDELRAQFNEAAGATRVITFLSPTCGPCRYGQGVVRGLFEEFPAERLAGFIIWVPMLPSDSADAAKVEHDTITDPRVRWWFDEDKAAANTWSSFIGLPTTTWDVYAVYAAGFTWDEGMPPPSPKIWMHQLPPTPATQLADRLDPVRLADDWLGLIGADSLYAAELAAKLHAKGKVCSERHDSRASGLDT
jgi:thiol-disulfide isomerase/thioredoxin